MPVKETSAMISRPGLTSQALRSFEGLMLETLASQW